MSRAAVSKLRGLRAHDQLDLAVEDLEERQDLIYHPYESEALPEFLSA